MSITVLDKVILKKQTLAQKLCKDEKLLSEIEEQIAICEELGRPLTKEIITQLCDMTSVVQIQNKCRSVKFA